MIQTIENKLSMTFEYTHFNRLSDKHQRSVKRSLKLKLVEEVEKLPYGVDFSSIAFSEKEIRPSLTALTITANKL